MHSSGILARGSGNLYDKIQDIYTKEQEQHRTTFRDPTRLGWTMTSFGDSVVISNQPSIESPLFGNAVFIVRAARVILSVPGLRASVGSSVAFSRRCVSCSRCPSAARADHVALRSPAACGEEVARMSQVNIDARLVVCSHRQKERQPECTKRPNQNKFFLVPRQHSATFTSVMVLDHQENESSDGHNRHRCLRQVDNLNGVRHHFHDEMSHHQCEYRFYNMSERMFGEQRHIVRGWNQYTRKWITGGWEPRKGNPTLFLTRATRRPS